MPKDTRYSEFAFAEGWPSVSTITGQLEKPFLYGWYAKLGKEAYLINNDSKKIGNLIDNEICHYFGDKIIPEQDRTVLEGKAYTEGGTPKEYFFQALKNFYKLAEHIKPVSVVGQKVVYSKEHKYIGTFDRLLVVDGKLVLSDWKATNSVGYEYKMQLEAYYRALTEMMKAGTIDLGEHAKLEWHEYPIWICQFPKKEEVDLNKHIVRFKPKEKRFENFLNLLKFYNGKHEDEEEDKQLKAAAKELKPKKTRSKKSNAKD